ncbi:hypothetical protein JTE90_013307 [Oedothorax gibbosus]|uniref:Uncharacterized protein n=1 Tax=Oedothorax gibbosus TaxID=931172 RepID=A0AAV6VCZ2_9ARAC|nr:hypothetical protein JTE90_013307 [Oedothorax gibbosus]
MTEPLSPNSNLGESRHGGSTLAKGHKRSPFRLFGQERTSPEHLWDSFPVGRSLDERGKDFLMYFRLFRCLSSLIPPERVKFCNSSPVM